MEAKKQSVTASWINIIAGIWLIVAPTVLAYINSTPRTNDIWLGAIVGIIALIRLLSPNNTPWLSWVNLIAGIWLIIAPFALGYIAAAPLWNDIIVGIIVAATAVWNATSGNIASRHRVST